MSDIQLDGQRKRTVGYGIYDINGLCIDVDMNDARCSMCKTIRHTNV